MGFTPLNTFILLISLLVSPIGAKDDFVKIETGKYQELVALIKFKIDNKDVEVRICPNGDILTDVHTPPLRFRFVHKKWQIKQVKSMYCEGQP